MIRGDFVNTASANEGVELFLKDFTSEDLTNACFIETKPVMEAITEVKAAQGGQVTVICGTLTNNISCGDKIIITLADGTTIENSIDFIYVNGTSVEAATAGELVELHLNTYLDTADLVGARVDFKFES